MTLEIRADAGLTSLVVLDVEEGAVGLSGHKQRLLIELVKLIVAVGECWISRDKAKQDFIF